MATRAVVREMSAMAPSRRASSTATAPGKISVAVTSRMPTTRVPNTTVVATRKNARGYGRELKPNGLV